MPRKAREKGVDLSKFIVNQGMIIFKNVLLLKSAIPGFLDYILKVLFIAQ